MALGTLYSSALEPAEPLRTRVIFPVSLVKYYKLDVKISGPDSYFPEAFPGRFVPSFRYENGKILTESIPIAFLLIDQIKDKGNLLGDGSAADHARILSWMNMFNLDFMTSVTLKLKMILGALPPSKPDWDLAGVQLDRIATIINDHLTENTYLVGHSVTLADLYCAPVLLRLLTVIWGPEDREKYPALMRWYNTVKHSPIYDGFFDTLELTKEAGKLP